MNACTREYSPMSSVTVSLIVAIASDGTIGDDGTLPWRLPADLAHFKRITMGHPIIMGRRTFEAIGRPLPGRMNIIVTRCRSYHAGEPAVVHDVDAAIRHAANADAEVFIIGGAQIYADSLGRGIVDRLIVSHVDAHPSGDTRFPSLDWSQWSEEDRTEHHDDSPSFDIVTYRRNAG